MSPKLKAEELFKRMYAVHSNSASDITSYFAKQCALVAVNELIRIAPWASSIKIENDSKEYYMKVKQEIVENL